MQLLMSQVIHGFVWIQSISRTNNFLSIGNIIKARIEGIRTQILILNTGCHLDLENCLYVHECARNLVYVGRFDDVAFNFKIGNSVFSLYKHKYYYGFGSFIDCFHCFNLDVNFVESLFPVEHSIGNKRSVHNKRFSFL